MILDSTSHRDRSFSMTGCAAGVVLMMVIGLAVRAGAVTVLASDFGYDPTDATPALQAAIDSGADRVVVSRVGSDWIVRPIVLRSNQELVFEPGVVVTAMRNEFHGRNDCLFSAKNAANVRITGYNATLRMHKADYQDPLLYTPSQWRHVIYLISCQNVTIQGMVLRDSGGDGLFIGAGLGEPPCVDIRVQDVVCDNNYRQGMSINSAENLVIENCILKNTHGTDPQAGIDFEPDYPEQRLVNCLVRGCQFENNTQASILVYPQALNETSLPISLTFSKCHISNAIGWGIQISPLWSDGGDGWVRFEDCVIEDVRGPGLYMPGKYAYKTRVEFIRCTWQQVAKESFNGFPANPLVVTGDFAARSPEYGGLYFEGCVIKDHQPRHFILTQEPAESLGCANLKGTIAVLNPFGVTMALGRKAHDMALNILPLSAENALRTTAGAYPPDIRVYPNPASDRVTFRLDHLQFSETLIVDLYSSAGRPVFHTHVDVPFHQPEVILSLGHLPPGIYPYVLRRAGRIQTGKLAMKNH